MIEWEVQASLPVTDPTEGVRALQRLSEHSTQLISSASIKDAADTMLGAAIDLHRADFGNVQLLKPEANTLEIIAQRGFDAGFLETFKTVSAEDSCACGRAIAARATVFVHDVEEDPEYAPFVAAARAAGYRAVQSTPMISSTDQLVGVLSTHFRRPHVPSPAEMHVVQLYARQAADIVVRIQQEDALRRTEAIRGQVAAELDHRLKNVITMIQSIARQSLRRNQGLGEFAEAFEQRLQALARAHDHLQRAHWKAASVASILREQLAPFAGPRINWSGPDALLGANAAYTLALVVHELAVNARKHGALSVGSGRITIEWQSAGDGMLTLRWTESDGPAVMHPASRGFGTALIGSLGQAGVAGTELRFEPTGVVCILQLPLASDDHRSTD